MSWECKELARPPHAGRLRGSPLARHPIPREGTAQHGVPSRCPSDATVEFSPGHPPPLVPQHEGKSCLMVSSERLKGEFHDSICSRLNGEVARPYISAVIRPRVSESSSCASAFCTRRLAPSSRRRTRMLSLVGKSRISPTPP